ncbi:MAG: peptidoglycan bridge formation glycyltransferase FemA/FemB family protein [Candidatus Moraniibacteriota bacterium]
MEEQKMAKSVQENSPVGEFLQSLEWRKFQESVGRKTFHLEGENFWANIILHTLPIVGKYFYIPKGPEMRKQEIEEIINLAKENNAGWIRIEPSSEESLEVIRKNTKYKIIKAPHDVQPREIFVIDISKSEEELLAEMKPKTRYNIRLAEKKDIKIFNIGDDKYVEEFLRLTAVMAKRQGITAHPENYYRKMLENISGDILKLYVAEYEGRVIAANLVVFYGDTCIYLHGASDDEYRNVMAPYLLQWRQICDAKKAGCVRYDFGGVKNPPHPNPLLTKERGQNAGKSPSPYQGEGGRRPDEVNPWSGITKFKTGFSPETVPTIFPGSYDIILDNKKYWAYKFLQKLKNIF